MSTWPEAFEKVIKSSVKAGHVGPAVLCGSGQKLSKAQQARGILLHAVGHHQDAPWSMVSHMDPYGK